MRARLPVLGARSREPNRPPGLDAVRITSPRPLVCIVDPDEDVACLEFAVTMVAAVCAAGGSPAALLASSDGEWKASAMTRLQDAGAVRVILLQGPDLASDAVVALNALSAGTVAVGLGWPIAVCMRALLLVRVREPFQGRGPRAMAGVDLEPGAQPQEVARTLGAWLAHCLDASTPNG